MKLRRRITTWVAALLALTLGLGGLGISQAYAAAGDTPPHTKNIADNEDGTYTISLDIVGESEKKPNNINVIVIVDTSGSMTQQRMTAAKNAVNSLANSLYAYNTQSEPDTVEMALVQFATSSRVAQAPTSTAATFRTAVNNLGNTGDGGTNWESALQTANGVDFDDDDQTFAVFVSDGNPTFRTTQNGWNDWKGYPYNQWGSGYEDATNIYRCYTTAVDDAQALATKVTPANFFTIGAFGNVDRMEQLTDDAGSNSSTNYYSASDTAALNQAIADILAKIEMAGFADAEIDDGTTNQVTTTSGEVAELLELVPNFQYYRSGGTYGTMQPWTDAPEAKVVNGEVEWDLSSVGVLENGVRYTVTFDCYPSQYTYDTIAQLKNGDILYSDLDPEIQKYIVDNGDGSYSLRTNTNAGIAWDDTRDDEGRQTDSYTNPDPVKTASSTLTATKEWEGGDPDVESLEITVMMGDEPFHSATISAANGWSTTSFISPGIIKGGQVLPGAEGHDFKFAELGDEQYHWELESPVVHPMLINGTLTMLIMVDEAHEAPAGAQTYTINGSTYYVDSSAAGLTAVNHRRSNLNLTKAVTGEDAPADAKFPFQLTVNNSKAPASAPEDDPDHESDYWIWLSIRDENGQGVTGLNMGSGVVEDSGGYYYAPNGTTFSLEIGAGWSLRFLNLPSNTTYTFAEGTLPEGFAFSKSELTQGKDSTFNGAQTTTGTIENTKTSYYVTYTNDYALTDLEITKVWDDAGNQDGIRPDAASFANLLTLSPEVEGAEPIVTDNGDNTYTITYTGLPRFTDGEEVTYTVTEDAIEGYTTTGSPAEDHGTITNTHTPEVTTVTVVKEWDDSDDIGEIRPTSISAQLTADGEASGDPVTLDESNQWTYTWENLPKYKDGVAIEYAADETEVPSGYTEEEPVVETADDGTTTITLTNTYTPTPVSVDPPVQKIITGKDDLYNGGDFTFTIAAVTDGAPMPENTEITNSSTYELADKPGFYEFGVIEFTMPGTYEYTVTESGTVPGVTNDSEASKTLTFTVTDDGNGNLVVDPTTDQVQLSFTNTYNASGEATITVTKALEGAEWPSGKTLTLTLTGAEGAPMPETTTATLTAEGSVSFGPIAYGLADAGQTYTYTISEDGFGAGWTGSGDVTATVEVTDNGDGTLATEVTYSPEEGIITNTYAATGEAVLEATKDISGAAWPEGKSITFTLAGQGGTLPEDTEVTLTEPGKATFDAITYDESDAGQTYTYTISEDGFGTGWTGSGDVTATVEVTDNGDGTLSTNVTYSPEDATITNTYEASGSVVLEANKVLEGREWADGESFTFTLYGPDGTVIEEKNATVNGPVTFSAISYDQDDAGKSYSYTISETSKLPGGVEKTDDIQVSVAVTDNGDGTLTATPTYTPEDATITNTYTADPVKAQINVAKKISGYIEGEDPNGNVVDRTFTVTMTGPKIDGELTTTITTEGGEGSASFDEIEYTFDDMVDDEGNRVTEKQFTYTVTETDDGEPGFTYDSNEYDVVVTVKDNQQGKLEVTDVTKVGEGENAPNVEVVNVFEEESVDVVLTAKKTIEDLSNSAEDATFTFVLTPGEGVPGEAQTKQVTTVDFEGSVDFDALTFTEAGEYTYTITESGKAPSGWIYDETVHNVTIVVNDNFETAILEETTTINGNSTTEVTFTNTYKAAATETTLEVTKAVDDTSDSAQDLEFEFTLAGDEPLPATTVGTAKDGQTVSFGPIAYEKAGTYNYTITETDGGEAGWTYDTTSYKVVVTVEDVDAQLVATAAYIVNDKPETSLTVTNIYDPQDATATPKALKTIEDQSASAPSETFTFNLVDADGNVVETKTRQDGGPVSFSELTFAKVGTYDYTIQEVAGSTKGYTYDTAEHAVTITVTDPGDGQLTAEVTYADGEQATINNVYKADPVDATFDVTKKIEGPVVESSETTFTFDLAAVTEGAPMPEEATATVAGAGVATFGSITFEKAGTYTYKVTETKGDATGYTYDTASYNVVVEVTDNGGALEANVVEGDAITFVNTYKPLATGFTFDAAKELTGRDMTEGEFSFELTDADGNVVATATNAADGTVTFTTADDLITESGTYTYTATEIAGSAEGVAYDTTAKTVTVTVVDEAGQLVATVDQGEGVTFNNTYDPTATSAQLKATKVLEGRDLAAGEFTFELKDSDGKVVKTTTNLADGTVDFGAITFDKVGEYTFTATEIKGDDVHITYDEATVTYTVKVVDAGGHLEASVTSTNNATFTNTYKPAEPVMIDPPVQKVIKLPVGTKPGAATFTFTMKAITAGAPMPEGSADGVKTMTIDGAGSKEFGEVWFTEAGTYVYEISEVKGDAKGYAYDETVYTLTVEVTEDAKGNLVAKETYVASDGKSADKAVFTNTFTPEPPVLPQTSDDSVPTSTLVVTALTGVALVAAGSALRLRRNED